MKTITEQDVLRLVENEISDDREVSEILTGICGNPQLEQLYFLLSSDDEEEDDAFDAQTTSAESALAEPEALTKWKSLNRRLRLAFLQCTLPDSIRQSIVSGVLKTSSPWKVPAKLYLHSDKQIVEGSLECPDGNLQQVVLTLNPPPGWQLISLTVLHCVLSAANSPTRIRLPPHWLTRNQPQSTILDSMRADSKEKSYPLAALSHETPKSQEMLGEAFHVYVDVKNPNSAEVRCKTATSASLLPIHLRALNERLQELACTASVFSPPGESISDLFSDTLQEQPVWLEVRMLDRTEFSLLQSFDSAALLGSTQREERQLISNRNNHGHFTVDLSDLPLLADENALICLNVAIPEQR